MISLTVEIKKPVLTAFFLTVSCLSGQEGEWINVAPFDDALRRTVKGSFISENEGWIFRVPNDILYHTSDGGMTWDIVHIIPETNGYSFFQDIQFVDENYGFAIVKFRYSSVEMVEQFWKTSDGGSTWVDMTDTTFMYPDGYTHLWVRPFYFLNDSVGFAGGPPDVDNNRGRIYKTIDRGENWYETNILNSGDPLYDGEWIVNKFYFIDNLHGWAVCSGPPIDAGMAWKTIDGGENWEIAILPGPPDIFDVHFIDENHGGVTARNFYFSDLILTEDNFNSESYHYYWDDLNVGFILRLRFQTENIIWVVGQYGNDLKILKSVNGGETFNEYQIIVGNSSLYCYQIEFFENTGYIFATNRLLKYEGGDVNINTDYPEKTSFSRIYPNPFNSTTTIRYGLPESSDVSVIVYDITGREIIELVDSRVPAGDRRVVWNGRDRHGNSVASGLYIYRLVAKSNKTKQIFTQSNKMVLLK